MLEEQLPAVRAKQQQEERWIPSTRQSRVHFYCRNARKGLSKSARLAGVRARPAGAASEFPSQKAEVGPKHLPL